MKSQNTYKIFWDDPYLTESKAVVTGVNGNDITLNQTIFYAFSGGQESDEGTINGEPVLQARKVDKEIIYTLAANKLNIGDEIIIKVDWQRRYRLMRLHFAAEIMLALIYKELPSIKKIGAHISSDKARIDFEDDGDLKSSLQEIENFANELITANKKITSNFNDQENERRYWEIQDFAKVPCGGTHLKTTGEVGRINLKRKTAGKGKERIEIFLQS